MTDQFIHAGDEWYLLAEEKHQQLQSYVAALQHLYTKNKAMYELDCQPEGFEWINADDAYRSIFSFVRHSADGKNNLLFVINFTPVPRRIPVGVPRRKQYRLILNSMSFSMAEAERSSRKYTRR